jgi:hypothetical protein
MKFVAQIVKGQFRVESDQYPENSASLDYTYETKS